MTKIFQSKNPDILGKLGLRMSLETYMYVKIGAVLSQAKTLRFDKEGYTDRNINRKLDLISASLLV